MNIFDGIFVYKLFDKRDAFAFIVRMPYLESNIPSFVFYGSFKSEIHRIAKNTLRYVKLFVARMKYQGGLSSRLKRSISSVFLKHPEIFTSFEISQNQLLFDIFAT